MATATAYRNSDDVQSAKNAPGSVFNRHAQVRASVLPERYKNLLCAMLSKNRFGDDLWLSTESLQVIIGRVCFRRKTDGFDTRGRRLGTCEVVSRRTVQKWIDDAERGEVLRKVIPENQWVGLGKARRFRRSATYELNPAKLVPAKTWDEWHAEQLAAKPRPRRIGQHSTNSSPTAQEPAPPQPTPSAAPVPLARAMHRSNERKGRRLTPREGPALVAKMTELMRGCTRQVGVDGYGFNLDPGDPRYRAPMSQEKALIGACMTLGITEDDARDHLKLCGWKFDAAGP